MPIKFLKKYKFLIIPGLFIAGMFLLMVRPPDNRQNISSNMLDYIKAQQERLLFSDSAYKKYRHISDSLSPISAWNWNRISTGQGEGWFTFLFGIRKIYECDSCKQIVSGKKAKELGYQDKYFLELKNYTLKLFATFYIDKNKYFIRSAKFKKVNEGLTHINFQSREIPVRFATNLDNYPKPENSLLIPVSRSTYTFLDVLMKIIFIPVAIFLFWAIFILPCKVLYRIATGKVFVIQNIKNLQFAGWTLIVTLLVPIIFSWIIKLIMGDKIPDEIYFPVWLYLSDNKGWIISAAALLILAGAFKSGYKLQQEQDLTV